MYSKATSHFKYPQDKPALLGEEAAFYKLWSIDYTELCPSFLLEIRLYPRISYSLHL
jgi:hypothetical protein